MGTKKLLLDSFYLLKRQAAPGVDRVTWSEYEEGVEARITGLHDRIHRQAYRAQPSRRVYIPKPDGRQRPLGIAALEDKIVQQAVATIELRIADPRILRLIRKWLTAGVSEDGQWSETKVGTPQGAVISPLFLPISTCITYSTSGW
jgi:retron-type reverse transcriptase